MMRVLTTGLGLTLLLAQAAAASELDCLIQPKRSLTVSSAVEGLVDEVHVDRGDFVEVGQVIARLKDDVEHANLAVARARAEAEAQLRGSRASLTFARRTLERSEALQQGNVLSAGRMDEVQRDRALAQASLRQAQESRDVAELEVERAAAVLDLRTIRSPVKGVVIERILSPGEWADPPQVVRVAQIDPLTVEVFAPLALLGEIEVGGLADVRPEEPVGGVYQATVSAVDRVVDAASGTLAVQLEPAKRAELALQ